MPMPHMSVASTPGSGSQETFTVLEALRWIREPNHNLSKAKDLIIWISMIIVVNHSNLLLTR